MSRFRGRALLAGLVCALLLAACQTYQYKATVLGAPKPLIDFSLPSTTGDVFTLSAHRDVLVLLYFGYTNCPDACPATLTQLNLALRRLGGDAAHVQVAFVTVDPVRDTPDVLRAYLAKFNPSFIGLRTPDAAALQAIAGEFGAYYEPQSGGTPQPDAPYLVAHTSSILVVRDQALRAVFPESTPAADLASDLAHMIQW